MEAFAQRYLQILSAIVSDPDIVVGDIDIFTSEENAEQAQDAGAQKRRLADLVAAAGDADPSATALVHDGTTVQFGQLSGLVKAMAVALPGTDADATLTMALMSAVPGLAAGGPTALDAALSDLRSNAAATLDLSTAGEGNTTT